MIQLSRGFVRSFGGGKTWWKIGVVFATSVGNWKEHAASTELHNAAEAKYAPCWVVERTNLLLVSLNVPWATTTKRIFCCVVLLTVETRLDSNILVSNIRIAVGAEVPNHIFDSEDSIAIAWKISRTLNTSNCYKCHLSNCHSYIKNSLSDFGTFYCNILVFWVVAKSWGPIYHQLCTTIEKIGMLRRCIGKHGNQLLIVTMF